MNTLEKIIDEVWAIMETHNHLHRWCIERDADIFEDCEDADLIEQAINEETDATCHYEISGNTYLFLIEW